MDYENRAQTLLANAAVAEQQAEAAHDPQIKEIWTNMAESCRDLARLLLNLQKEKQNERPRV